MEDKAFVTMIHMALNVEPEWQIGDILGVSRKTVSRWFSGTNLPHPALRLPIQSILRERELI